MWLEVAPRVLVPLAAGAFIFWLARFLARSSRARAYRRAAANPEECLSCSGCGKPFHPESGLCPHCWRLQARNRWSILGFIMFMIWSFWIIFGRELWRLSR
jgi:hypothetical protein